MGGAQPLAVTMNDGVALCIDVDPWRVERRLEHRYLDEIADSLDDAVARCVRARDERRAAVGRAWSATPPRCCRSCSRWTSRPTSSPTRPAPTTRSATCRSTSRPRPRPRWRAPTRRSSSAAAARAWPRTAGRWSGFLDKGSEVFDYGNSLRTEAKLGGFERAFDYPGFLPAYIRPLFCEGKGPFRWVALSGDPADIAATDRAVLEEFPDDEGLHRWIRMAGERVAFQGLPARICWLGYGERHRLGLRFNEMVRRGELKAPIVIGRDHLDSGSVASPYRETEAMLDGSDAIADWPLLNALVNTSSRRHVGEHPPRRRGRHRPQHPRRHGVPRRRHRPGRREAVAGARSPTPAWASSATPTPATNGRIEVADERGVRIPMQRGRVMRHDRGRLLARRRGVRARRVRRRARRAGRGRRSRPTSPTLAAGQAGERRRRRRVRRGLLQLAAHPDDGAVHPQVTAPQRIAGRADGLARRCGCTTTMCW